MKARLALFGAFPCHLTTMEVCMGKYDKRARATGRKSKEPPLRCCLIHCWIHPFTSG